MWIPSNPTPGVTVTPRNSSECTFQGNADIYGLGIRLGIYLQAFSITVATLFNQDSLLEKLSFGNGLFQFALTVGLLIETTKTDEFRAVEAALVVLLALCSSYQAPLKDTIKGFRESAASGELRQWIMRFAVPVSRAIVELILLVYSVWFWFVGLDRLAHSAECTTYAFFFARVDLYGWFRTLGKVYVVLELFSQVVLQVAFLAVRRQESEGGIGPPFSSSSSWYSKFFGVNRILLTLFFILSVELMARWNRITEISSLNSVGQLVAFLVGMNGVLTVAIEWGDDKQAS
ncbi:hypothetical protein B0T16DRAFT_411807 [Cercophora newfieldiana]|uniref:Uncharacterized protein n=1 Tax=Cercophora newfieldiana TaxID=92897 RepID=A0AA39Y744_9PEZI|nr:hypothetical protein B0T16DRAFT_411807 [Cercophora newfieldiana]